MRTARVVCFIVNPNNMFAKYLSTKRGRKVKLAEQGTLASKRWMYDVSYAYIR